MKYRRFKTGNNKYVLLSSFLVVGLLLGFVMYSSFAKFRQERTVDIIGGVVTSDSGICEYELGHSWNFDYTGSVQSFTIPCAGTYNLEVWGAQGGQGYGSKQGAGGKGGYASGSVSLSKDTVLYIGVGGAGAGGINGTATGGYNGGGNGIGTNGSTAGGGGGGTHIGKSNATIANTSKENLYIVAGGGGGGGSLFGDYTSFANTGGVGGGTTGGDAAAYGVYGRGGSQTSGGASAGAYMQVAGTYGKGGNMGDAGGYPGGGGGGGLYGGSSGAYYNGATGGGGGSGYIDGVTNGSMTNGQREGNGYASITLVQYDLEPPTLSVSDNVLSISSPGVALNGFKEYEYYVTTGSDVPDKNTVPTGVMSNNSLTITSGVDSTVYVRTVDIKNKKSAWSTGYSVVFPRCEYEPGYSWEFAYTGDIQNLTVPCDGVYKLEVYGGKGGGLSSNNLGGHSYGYTLLSADDVLYIVVGGNGKNCSWSNTNTVAGGYNGGGNGKNASSSGYCGGSGGGATHIAKVPGLLSEIGYDSFVTNGNGLIVAGGSGGQLTNRYYDDGGTKHDTTYKGGSGGGETGGTSAGGGSSRAGTQTTGYAFGEGGSGVKNSRAGGGGGLYGGKVPGTSTVNGSGGGSGYIGGVPSLTFKGVSYSPMTEQNISSTGSATITLIAY